MNDAVIYEREGAVGVITLNRPDNRNSMTSDLLDAFATATAAAAADHGARCVVVTGRGSCFSAGADLRAQIQREHGEDEKPRLPAEQSHAMYTAFLSVLDLEVPVVGALNGHAVGGGFGLSLLCDIRIGAEGAKYGANFARLGLHSGLGISYVLPRLVGVSNAAELLFTGRLVKGDEAARIGLLSRALPADEVLPAAMDLAREIASAAPAAVRMMKRSLYQGLGWDVRTAAWREAFAQAATVASDDAREGMQALLDKRDPAFTGR
ncbi:MAG: enoyl-CoA hydratase/isomerase family protein [Deltaproteobacteria bacterium]|nr:enoyl-CoA hydratase/isomerase family protein [Deltaproteobacteria bacterium]